MNIDQKIKVLKREDNLIHIDIDNQIISNESINDLITDNKNQSVIEFKNLSTINKYIHTISISLILKIKKIINFSILTKSNQNKQNPINVFFDIISNEMSVIELLESLIQLNKNYKNEKYLTNDLEQILKESDTTEILFLIQNCFKIKDITNYIFQLKDQPSIIISSEDKIFIQNLKLIWNEIEQSIWREGSRRGLQIRSIERVTQSTEIREASPSIREMLKLFIKLIQFHKQPKNIIEFPGNGTFSKENI